MFAHCLARFWILRTSVVLFLTKPSEPCSKNGSTSLQAVKSLTTEPPTTFTKCFIGHVLCTLSLWFTWTHLSDLEDHQMNYRDITIQTRPRKRDTINLHAFRCQLITIGNTRTYLLSETKRELERRHIFLLPGCKIIDDGVAYRIFDVWYSPRPMHPFITVYRDYAV